MRYVTLFMPRVQNIEPFIFTIDTMLYHLEQNFFRGAYIKSFETSISKVPLNFDETGRIHGNINYQVIRYPLVVGIISVKERQSF